MAAEEEPSPGTVGEAEGPKRAVGTGGEGAPVAPFIPARGAERGRAPVPLGSARAGLGVSSISCPAEVVAACRGGCVGGDGKWSCGEARKARDVDPVPSLAIEGERCVVSSKEEAGRP